MYIHAIQKLKLLLKENVKKQPKAKLCEKFGPCMVVTA